MQRRQAANQSAGVMRANGALLISQCDGLQGTQCQQAVGNDGNQDMTFQIRRVGNRNGLLRRVQAGQHCGQAAQWKHHDAQCFQRAIQAADQNLQTDQPADQAGGSEEFQVDNARLRKDQLLQ